ncbi:MAG TPA: hypothetical protein VMP11_01875 [Verrucomicrobiae bacterium]|nr:hypothetical protein [Verrucomicrobiae bacterium]
MNNPPELVTDRNVFLGLRQQCETIIDTKKRFPEFVFRRSFAKYFAIDHGEIHRKEFTSLLERMAYSSKDESVSYMTLAPDPVNYYLKNYKFYGLASFRPASLTERYLPVMFRDGQADSFLARGGDVGAFWGSSLKWAVFCDRISWELALIAVSEKTETLTDAGFRLMDSSLLLDYMNSLYYADPSKAREFTKTFAMNYRI